MYCPKYKCSLSNPDACLIRQITLKLGTELKGLLAQVELFQTQLNTTLEAIGVYTLTNPPE